MNINGFTVDTDKIGRGVYEIICEKGEDAIVSVGMIPLWAVEAVEKQTREKVIAIWAQQHGVSVETFKPLLEFMPDNHNEKVLKETVAEITHEVVLAIYQAASDAGKMIV